MTAVFSVALAAGDYTEAADKFARAVGIPVNWLPLIYIGLFGFALWLMRMEYESARYEFIADADTDYLSEPEIDDHASRGSETHRVTVLNSGHTPITVQVLLKNIAPLPVELANKLGMPLVPMGAGSNTSPVVITPGGRRAFNVASFVYYWNGDPGLDGATTTDDAIYVWHSWPGAPHEIAVVNYGFDLILAAQEGLEKSARFEFVRETASKSGRAFSLRRSPRTTLLNRLLNRHRLGSSPNARTVSPGNAQTPVRAPVKPVDFLYNR